VLKRDPTKSWSRNEGIEENVSKKREKLRAARVSHDLWEYVTQNGQKLKKCCRRAAAKIVDHKVEWARGP
jgi:hypothetical protein